MCFLALIIIAKWTCEQCVSDSRVLLKGSVNNSACILAFDVPPQEVLTKDSVTVSVDAVVYYRVCVCFRYFQS